MIFLFFGFTWIIFFLYIVKFVNFRVWPLVYIITHTVSVYVHGTLIIHLNIHRAVHIVIPYYDTAIIPHQWFHRIATTAICSVEPCGVLTNVCHVNGVLNYVGIIYRMHVWSWQANLLTDNMLFALWSPIYLHLSTKCISLIVLASFRTWMCYVSV